jgi:hypothetical protein
VHWDNIDTNDDAVNFIFLNAAVQSVLEYKSDGTKITHKTMAFSTSAKGLSPSWILLDNQSTCDIFANAKLLTNIRRVQG